MGVGGHFPRASALSTHKVGRLFSFRKKLVIATFPTVETIAIFFRVTRKPNPRTANCCVSIHVNGQSLR